ncbi:MAG: helix-turn-helix transcriptional regulator [Clostridia bacterium]|nr:helix-turn-helix transcriptional regulator [Clostridia bacterium]
MKFSEKIVRLRKIKGITQDEFASAVGVSRQAVYKWECGQSYPEASKLVEIKALFGISIDDLLDDSYEVALPEKKKRKRISKAKIEKLEMAVEKEASKEEAVEENAAEITVMEVEAEPVIEASEPETVVSVAEKIIEKTAAEAPVTEEKAAPSVSEEKSNDDSKKRGFFSRLFGRK